MEQTHVPAEVIHRAARKTFRLFFYTLRFTTHRATSVVRVCFTPAVFLTRRPLFIFYFYFFNVYESYVNLASFKLHFQVLELQIKAGAGGSVNLWRSPQLNWVSAVAQVSNPCSRICTSGVVQAHGCFLPSLKAVKALLDEMSKTSHNNLEHAVSSSHL